MHSVTWHPRDFGWFWSFCWEKIQTKMALRHSSSQLWVYLPLNTILTHHHIKTYQVYQSGYQLAILLPAVPERLQLMWWRGWGLPSSHIRMEVPDMCRMFKHVKHQWSFDFSYGSHGFIACRWYIIYIWFVVDDLRQASGISSTHVPPNPFGDCTSAKRMWHCDQFSCACTLNSCQNDSKGF